MQSLEDRDPEQNLKITKHERRYNATVARNSQPQPRKSSTKKTIRPAKTSVPTSSAIIKSQTSSVFEQSSCKNEPFFFPTGLELVASAHIIRQSAGRIIANLARTERVDEKAGQRDAENSEKKLRERQRAPTAGYSG